MVDYRWSFAKSFDFFQKFNLHLNMRDMGFCWHNIKVSACLGVLFWSDFVLWIG